MSNKIQLKPSDRASIDFAEEERVKSLGEDGYIIHEKDLEEGLAREKYSLEQECYSSGQSFGGQEETTLSCSHVEFEVPRDGKYMFLYTIVYTSSSGTATIRLKVDGVNVSRITFSGSAPSGQKTIVGFANLQAGSHAVSLSGYQNQSGATGEVPAYTTNKCYIMEV